MFFDRLKSCTVVAANIFLVYNRAMELEHEVPGFDPHSNQMRCSVTYLKIQ